MTRPQFTARRALTRSRFRFTFESLEHRWAMDGTAVSAAAGLPWLDVDHLTYSFALDGTQFGAEHSRLFEEMRGAGTTSAWQAAFQSAFMEWLGPLGKQIEPVADSGMPFGMLGPTQHDQRVGDIRIAAVPLSNNVMAESIPHNMLTQGSWAGDIVLNSNADWTDLHQVFSVAMHEFGHVLGLGHSPDPASPMFFHGVYSALHPTATDIADLKKIYAGVTVETSDGTEASHGQVGTWEDEPQFQFDVTQAIPLSASLATTAQYSTSGALTSAQPTRLYELLSIGEIDHAQYLNLAVLADQYNGLMPQVTLYDMDGDKIVTTVLHNAAGVLTLQANDVEPNHAYYVAVSAAVAPADFQVGSFTLFASYASKALSTTQIGSFNLSRDWPIAEQAFDVSTSRLIHVHAQASSTARSLQTAVWLTLVDEADKVVAQLAMPVGTTRSAPLFFVEPGHYRLIMQAGNEDGSAISPVALRVSIDEVSIDVGPGIIDPTLNPNLTCSTPGNDPTTCLPSTPLVLVDPPVYPDPSQLPAEPIYPSIPPWQDPTWHYWPIITMIFPQHNSIMPLDSSGDSLTTALDALRIINAINSSSQVASQIVAGFVDVNNDRQLTPLDALLVINYLNQLGAGEGESVALLNSPASSNTNAVHLSLVDLDYQAKRRAARHVAG